jgi:ABC-2 type transport system permease protein
MADTPTTAPSTTVLGLPKFSRVWLIAMRDFMGYVKTWGFWLSFLMPIIFGLGGFYLSNSDIDLSPPKYEVILDQTGGYHEARILDLEDERVEEARSRSVEALSSLLPEDEQKAFIKLVKENGSEAGIAELQRLNAIGADNVSLPESSLVFIDPPADTLDRLRPYLDGSKPILVEGEERRLNGALIISGTKTDPKFDYWTRNFNSIPAERLLNRYKRRLAAEAFLAPSGIDRPEYNEMLENVPPINIFDPTKTTQAVDDDGEPQTISIWDRAPFFAGAALGFFLLMTIFAGSIALLTSMIEEKMNKLLEMMLASVKFSEIMLGKMIGAALLTMGSLIPYLLVGIGAAVYFLLFGNAEQSAAITEAFPISTVIFSVLYLVLGYMFYAAILISLGALAQSMQDAQTLSVPMVMVMFAGVFVIMIGFQAPDSGIVVAASIFPLTSPFAMMIRLATDPPLWQVLLSLALLFASVVGVMALCARIFRFGVLSGGGVGVIKSWFMRTVLRRKA